MKINSLFNFFVPKDTQFFPLLLQSASEIEHGANLLAELFSNIKPERREELCHLIKLEETKNDKTTASIFQALNETFITPFDREDIGSLADGMDDVLDIIHRAADKVLLYAPRELPGCTMQLAEILKKGTGEILCSITELKQMKKTDKQLKVHCKEIKRLEEEADVIHENGIKNLFENEKDAVELVKLKEIIQELEKAANKINAVGKIIKTIIVKYA